MKRTFFLSNRSIFKAKTTLAKLEVVTSILKCCQRTGLISIFLASAIKYRMFCPFDTLVFSVSRHKSIWARPDALQFFNCIKVLYFCAWKIIESLCLSRKASEWFYWSNRFICQDSRELWRLFWIISKWFFANWPTEVNRISLKLFKGIWSDNYDIYSISLF